MNDLKDVSKSDILQRYHLGSVRLEQIGTDRVSGVENCLRMAYVCQQEQNSSTLGDMGAGGLGRGGSRHLSAGVGFACDWCVLSNGV